MDYLKDVKKMDQVYSSELNEVLIKTPPRLFRYALIVFGICLLIVGVLSFIIEYEKSIEFNYVMYPSESGKSVEVLFFSDQDISNELLQKGISLRTDENILPGSADKINLVIDSMHYERLFKINGEFQPLEKQELAKLSELTETDVKYKYYLLSQEIELQRNLEQFRIGKINIPTGKAKLYKMFFS